jgi:hypothetical protein
MECTVMEFNSIQSGLKITIEKEENNRIYFLNLTITNNNNILKMMSIGNLQWTPPHPAIHAIQMNIKDLQSPNQHNEHRSPIQKQLKYRRS